MSEQIISKDQLQLIKGKLKTFGITYKQVAENADPSVSESIVNKIFRLERTATINVIEAAMKLIRVEQFKAEQLASKINALTASPDANNQ